MTTTPDLFSDHGQVGGDDDGSKFIIAAIIVGTVLGISAYFIFKNLFNL
jgi:hypothetical protein